MPSVNRHVPLLFRMGERYLNQALAGTGLTSGTAPLLLELRDGGDRHPAALAHAVGVNKAHVTRSLRLLSRDGYVDVRPDPSDGRMLRVSLTDTGRAAADATERAIRTWLTIVSDGVAPADLRVIDRVLDAFYANAVRHFAGPRGDTT
ncbi:MAG: MarR family transcriptional regulator [Candidatus Nanopelagicales bacterium]